MDLQTAVACSMLPASRGKIAATFRDLAHDPASGLPFLEFVWAASARHDVLPPSPFEAFMEAAGRALDEGRRIGIDAIALFDPRYPPLLACTRDPPPVLWTRGALDALSRPAVAVVGSRAATPYALQVGGRLAGELAGLGLVVSSGLARGVDSAAHRGCLDAGGTTIAVQGCGLDRVYPPEHAELASRIVENGLMLAELGPGAPPLPDHFPLRNRIISGISLGTVVVEASEKSGSLITARYALEQGRDVMAVPGSVLSGRNGGSHALLKDGARVVETAADVLEGLGWTGGARPAESANPLQEDALLVEMAPGEPYTLEELADRLSQAGSALLARLTELELAGRITVSNGRFVRV